MASRSPGEARAGARSAMAEAPRTSGSSRADERVGEVVAASIGRRGPSQACERLGRARRVLNSARSGRSPNLASRSRRSRTSGEPCERCQAVYRPEAGDERRVPVAIVPSRSGRVGVERARTDSPGRESGRTSSTSARPARHPLEVRPPAVVQARRGRPGELAGQPTEDGLVPRVHAQRDLRLLAIAAERALSDQEPDQQSPIGNPRAAPWGVPTGVFHRQEKRETWPGPLQRPSGSTIDL